MTVDSLDYSRAITIGNVVIVTIAIAITITTITTNTIFPQPSGDFPFASSLSYLFFDIFFWLALAWYFDQVTPPLTP